jgi:putative transposase
VRFAESQSAIIECCNRAYRHEVLDANLFEDLDRVRDIIDEWITVCNEGRPYGALDKVSPRLFRQRTSNTTSSLPTLQGNLQGALTEKTTNQKNQ